MSRRNGGNWVNNSSCGLVVFQITTIPSWHIFHIKKTQFYILHILHCSRNDIFSGDFFLNYAANTDFECRLEPPHQTLNEHPANPTLQTAGVYTNFLVSAQKTLMVGNRLSVVLTRTKLNQV